MIIQENKIISSILPLIGIAMGEKYIVQQMGETVSKLMYCGWAQLGMLMCVWWMDDDDDMRNTLSKIIYITSVCMVVIQIMGQKCSGGQMVKVGLIILKPILVVSG